MYTTNNMVDIINMIYISYMIIQLIIIIYVKSVPTLAVTSVGGDEHISVRCDALFFLKLCASTVRCSKFISGWWFGTF